MRESLRESLCESAVDEAAARLITMLGLRACWFEPFPFDVQLPRIEPGRILLPAAEPGVAPWSLDAGIELPVRFSGLTLGRFVLVPASATSGVGFPPSARSDAISMAEHVGAAVGASMLAESERDSSGTQHT